MNVGELRNLVTLDDPIEDGTPVVFTPNVIWAGIRPSPPGAFEEERVTHEVTIRYHPQITYNTRIWHRGRPLYVRGIQNVDERNVTLVLFCEEVKTP